MKKKIFEDALKINALNKEFSLRAQIKKAGVENINPCMLNYARSGGIVENYLTNLGFQYSKRYSKQSWTAFEKDNMIIKIGYSEKDDHIRIFRQCEEITRFFCYVDDIYTKKEKIEKILDGLISIQF